MGRNTHTCGSRLWNDSRICFIINEIKREKMEWLKIDENNLPQKEVLAANFTPRSYGYKEKLVGWLDKDQNGVICCNTNSELLENCTHYIDLTEFDL
jgi:hypothetical protein